MSSASRTFRRRQLSQLRRLARCPDCNSEVRLVSADGEAPLAAQFSVGHDDTCPWFAAHGGAHREFRLVLGLDGVANA